MPENKWTRESARWLILEGLAIVVSILLAFSIEAWWDNRQKREEVQDLLIAVLGDFQYGKDFVDFYRPMSIARMDAADELLKASKDVASSIAEEDIDSLLADIGYFVDVDLMPVGSINALLTAGNIGLIESKRLRRVISGWPAFVERVRYNLQPDYDFLFDTYEPYIRIHGNFTQLMRGITHIPGHPERTDWQQTVILAGERMSHSELLTDNEFINILAVTRLRQFNILHELDDFDERLDESIQLVEQELQFLTD